MLATENSAWKLKELRWRYCSPCSFIATLSSFTTLSLSLPLSPGPSRIWNKKSWIVRKQANIPRRTHIVGKVHRSPQNHSSDPSWPQCLAVWEQCADCHCPGSLLLQVHKACLPSLFWPPSANSSLLTLIGLGGWLEGAVFVEEDWLTLALCVCVCVFVWRGFHFKFITEFGS